LSSASRVLLLGAAILLAFAAAVLLPAHMVDAGGLTAEQTAQHIDVARTAIVQLLAGAALLGGLFYTAATLRLNREGQITERFTNAVEQLGSSALETRVGGIYALERIMRDSQADHGPVVEILSAFVREHAKNRGPVPPESATRDWAGPPVPGLEALSSDVQSAVTVLGRRPMRRENSPLDLRNTDVRGVRAHAARLSGCILTEAMLDYSDLGEANLSEARLRKASLTHAWLRAADLRGASLRYVDLNGANLREADFTDADLEHSVPEN
jgi:hypothetical protein